ncbi:MAG TPA: palindromic element RPE4 domain-containing protein [Rickettsia endosymbiont of Omalisus fontisbellaquei]|nr:palindromic element RPE4 domain-containing protein [Rickettsia endosymbiont of Omalisus fontisbellaquei]
MFYCFLDTVVKPRYDILINQISGENINVVRTDSNRTNITR